MATSGYNIDMAEFVGVSGTWRRVRRKYIGVGGNWVEVRNGYVAVGGVAKKIYASLTISTNTRDYNVATAAGNPSSPCTIVVKISPGVVVGSSSTATPAFTTGSLPAGSLVVIVNQGKIVGRGGNGGPGGGGGGSNGLAGGNAIELTVDVVIDNTGGIIGGGGGGGAGAATWPGHAAQCGGGGGGQGDADSIGGAGFSGGVAGTNGTVNAPGIWVPQFHCAGGDGGTFGVAGVSSGSCDAQPGAAGGAPGKAINLVGHTVTYIAMGSIFGAVS